MKRKLIFIELILLILSFESVAETTSFSIAYSSKVNGQNDIYLTDIKGESKFKLTDFSGGNGYSAWSPDGKQIAFYAKYDDKKTWSIHTINTDGTNRARLTHDKNKWDYGPAWSPDGTKIAFARQYQDQYQVSQSEIWMMNSDGSEMYQLKSLSGGGPDFTPDGRIVYSSKFQDKKNEISMADPDGKNIVHLTDNDADEWHPEVSPNGKQIAFMSDRDGNHEIYVMNIDGSNQQRLTFNDVDDWYPSWSPDGSKIIFGSKTDGISNIYVMNSDGTSLSKIITNGSQAAWWQMSSPEPMASSEEREMSFWDIPNLERAYINASPIKKEDGIPVGELGVDGGNKSMILELAHEIAENENNKYDSLLIAYKGKLLFESYYSRGRINLPHPMASTTKAYTGLALGRAIQLGYLSMDDLDKPIADFFNDLDPDKFVEGVELITLHHALSMRSGLRIDSDQVKEWREKPEKFKGQDQVQAYFENSAPITSDSQSFLYQFDPNLVMQALDAVVPGTAKEFISKELLNKMEINNYDWKMGDHGLLSSGSGSSMISRDMIKWGTLVMNDGKWKGEQLIPEVFIEKTTDRLLLTGDDDIYGGGKDVSKQGYGYYWWSADLKTENKTYFAVSAQGGGGQFIILIEDLDLLVVVTAHDNDNSTLQLLAEKILPAFI